MKVGIKLSRLGIHMGTNRLQVYDYFIGTHNIGTMFSSVHMQNEPPNSIYWHMISLDINGLDWVFIVVTVFQNVYRYHGRCIFNLHQTATVNVWR